MRNHDKNYDSYLRSALFSMLALFLILSFIDASAEDGISILSRESWGAAPPIKAMAVSKPVRLTIHHTGTDAKHSVGLRAKLQALQKFSQSDAHLADGRVKGAWADVPYHYYIAEDGSIAEGRSPKFAGDSNTKYDLDGHLSIVLEGNFDRTSPTKGQIRSLEQLLVKLSKEYNIDSNHIGYHQEFAKTDCPGRRLKNIIPEIRKVIAVSRGESGK